MITDETFGDLVLAAHGLPTAQQWIELGRDLARLEKPLPHLALSSGTLDAIFFPLLKDIPRSSIKFDMALDVQRTLLRYYVREMLR